MTFTINLCNVGASFGAADVFSIDMANANAEDLASVSFRINDLGFDGQATETDFLGFSICADNRHGVFDSDPLIEIPSGPSGMPFPEVTIPITTTSGTAPVGMNCFVTGERSSSYRFRTFHKELGVLETVVPAGMRYKMSGKRFCFRKMLNPNIQEGDHAER